VSRLGPGLLGQDLGTTVEAGTGAEAERGAPARPRLVAR
jgi:hypothetical protein